MKKYQIIGGQYESFHYGEADTLVGAKRIASKHEEYWDNWQGWHTPKIYLAEDCHVVTCKGWITKRDGEDTIVPNPGATPVAVKHDGKWTLVSEA